MTRYINPSEILPEVLLSAKDGQPQALSLNGAYHLTSKSVNHSDTEVKPSDWESHMAKLVGLENEIISEDEEFQDDSISSPSSEPQEVSNKQTFSSNPFTKLGLVGTTTLVVFLLAGGFLLQIMGIGNQKPKKNNVATVQSQPQQKTESRLQNLETEVETLKTKLAFSEQEQAIKTAQQTLRAKKPTQASSPSSVVIPSRNTGSPQIQTVYVPRVVTVERVVRVPQPVSQPTTEPPVAKSIPTPEKVSQSVNSPVTKSTPTPEKISRPVSSRVATPVQQPPIDTDENVAIAEPTLQPVHIPNVSQPSPENQNPIPVGTSGKGVVATAIFGETSKARNSDEEKDVFVVTLQEPLKTRDGDVVLPANAQLLTEISSLSDRGLLYLSVTKVIWENKGNIVEKTLPKGVLGIRSPEGKPLFAKQHPNESGSISSMDMSVFVLGGLGKVAQLFNRTDSEVVTTNVAGTVITNSNKAPNFAAGGLEGGINAIVPQITQRNQQRISEKLQRTNIWFIPAGTKVEVYVNQPIKF